MGLPLLESRFRAGRPEIYRLNFHHFGRSAARADNVDASGEVAKVDARRAVGLYDKRQVAEAIVDAYLAHGLKVDARGGGVRVEA